MQIIRDPADVSTVADPELRQLIEKTIRDLSEDYPYDPAEMGYFLVVDPGDTLAAVSTQLGFDVMANRWTGKRFGDADFTPSFELVEEHAGYFELVYVIGQDGGGIELFVKKTASTAGGNAVDPDLLAMCARYATVAGPALAA